MKTRADLLLRDALARLFVAACAGERGPRDAVDALREWAVEPVPSAEQRRPSAEQCRRLAELQAENGRPLFDPGGQLGPEFAPLGAYARDRARRFAAALGWLAAEDGLGEALRAARAAWDAGLFFEVHELLEPEWMRASGSRKTALQGLILAGAGLHHLVGANRAGATGLLRDAARKLAESPELDGFELAAFGRGMADLAERIAAGAIASPADVGELPRF
jgi:hypothetical protein